MSTDTLTNLRDYLYGTLTPTDMQWLAAQLTEYAKKEDENFPLKRYTKEEINAMLDQAEANFAAGLGIPDEDAWDELKEGNVPENQLELAEAV